MLGMGHWHPPRGSHLCREGPRCPGGHGAPRQWQGQDQGRACSLLPSSLRRPWLETGTSLGPAATGRWAGLELCSSTTPSSSRKQSPHPLVPNIHQCSSRPVPPSTLITLWTSGSQSPGCPHCPCPPAVLLPPQCPLMPVSPVPEEEESVSMCRSLKGLQRGQKQLCLESLDLRLHHLWESPGEKAWPAR